MSTAFSPSVSGTISDLDGYSIQGDYGFSTMNPHSLQPETDDFGFDPAPMKSNFPVKMEQAYSPPDDSQFGDFNFDPVKDDQSRSPFRAVELDHMMNQNIAQSTSAISRYGQVTPPRSNSESSLEKTEQKSTKQRREAKGVISQDPAHTTPITRKRRNTRKHSIATSDIPEEDDKRKQSLEKNRLAAAKCRINKKEKTEKLQRDSHDKAVQNALLKDQIMRMKEEVQQMNALLLAHANCEGCKSPANIQEHLNNLGNEFFAQHIQGVSHQDFPQFGGMSFEDRDMEQEQYYSPTTDPSLINPPLPDFNREPEFDVGTPMHID